LAVSASVCFEQSYSGVEGDSASSTELFALLSNLADMPLRQDIAVTGSIDQWGRIQAIGAVNDKIEGFYDVCSQIELTGKQGVCIPASNVKNLVLRQDVRQAISEGKFHIYPIETVDQGLELLTGIEAGAPDQEGTLHWRIDQKLTQMAESLRKFGITTAGTRPSQGSEKQESGPPGPSGEGS
jgi:predicted ATP-dependent protease